MERDSQHIDSPLAVQTDGLLRVRHAGGAPRGWCRRLRYSSDAWHAMQRKKRMV